MKSARKTMALAMPAGLAAFVVDALFDFLFFYEGSFLDVLLFDLSPREIYFRCALLLLFVGFGPGPDQVHLRPRAKGARSAGE